MIRSSNPSLNANTFTLAKPHDSSSQMTIQGTVNKTFILLLFLLLPACYVWDIFFKAGSQEAVIPYITGGVIGA